MKSLRDEIVHYNQNKSNIETRFANRMQSIFSAIGQIVNDFYLEIGIYCIGLLNASLVAWSIYTDLVANSQPLLYAIALGVIALVAVEGLAIYLVGAAAKTNNGWLWFFSVIFAAFFTFAHYQVAYHNTRISSYITYAIPFFVVIGYWARTLKIQIEDNQERKRQIEDEERQFVRQKELIAMDKKQEIDLAKIEANKAKNSSQNGLRLQEIAAKLTIANQAKQEKIDHRRQELLTLVNSQESYTQREMAETLGVSLGTIKNDLKALNGSVKK